MNVTISRKAHFNAAHKLYRPDWSDKNADKIDKMLLRLPSGPGYNKKDIIKIVNQLNEF